MKRLDPKIFRYTKNSWNLRFLRYWPKSLHPLQRINMFVLLEIVISKAQECISSLDFVLFFALLQEIATKIIIIWEWNVRSHQLLTAREINWRQWGFEKFATFLFYFGQFLYNSVEVNILPRLSSQIFLGNSFKQRQLLRPKVSLDFHSYIYPIDLRRNYLLSYFFLFTVWCSYNLQVMHLNAQKVKKKLSKPVYLISSSSFSPQ